jgi:hypothetical protein
MLVFTGFSLVDLEAIAVASSNYMNTNEITTAEIAAAMARVRSS